MKKAKQKETETLRHRRYGLNPGIIKAVPQAHLTSLYWHERGVLLG